MAYNVWKCKHCGETIKFIEKAPYLALIEVPKAEFDAYNKHYDSLKEHRCI